MGGLIGKAVTYTAKVYNAYDKMPATLLNNIMSSPVMKWVSNKKSEYV